MADAENDFLAVAISGGANVQAQGDYAGSAPQEDGFPVGAIPPSPVWNKMLRQATYVVSCLAGLIAHNLNEPALDDGNATEFTALLNQLLPPATGGQLQKFDATHLILAPVSGGQLNINGVNYPIPAALKLAVWGASTFNYVYAYMNAGVMTLENSATVPVLAANGMPIKGADATRTCVGFAYPDATPNFNDSPALRNVGSYFNRRNKTIQGVWEPNINVNSDVPVEISAGARAEITSWGNEGTYINVSGSALGGAMCSPTALVGVDGAATANYNLTGYIDATVTVSPAGATLSTTLAEGHHLLSPWGYSTPAQNIAFYVGVQGIVRN